MNQSRTTPWVVAARQHGVIKRSQLALSKAGVAAWERTGRPAPRVPRRVRLLTVDASWPGICVEIDGPAHKRPRSKVDDRIKDAALRASGQIVLRFTEDDLNHRPALVLRRLAAAFQGGELATA